MPFCTGCGTSLPDSARFRANCGLQTTPRLSIFERLGKKRHYTRKQKVVGLIVTIGIMIAVVGWAASLSGPIVSPELTALKGTGGPADMPAASNACRYRRDFDWAKVDADPTLFRGYCIFIYVFYEESITNQGFVAHNSGRSLFTSIQVTLRRTNRWWIPLGIQTT